MGSLTADAVIEGYIDAKCHGFDNRDPMVNNLKPVTLERKYIFFFKFTLPACDFTMKFTVIIVLINGFALFFILINSATLLRFSSYTCYLPVPKCCF